MHLLKVILLVSVTLAAMRLTSWFVLWGLSRLAPGNSPYQRLASNVVALLGFAGLLIADRVPGEVVDLQALAFGILVFGVFFAIDARWLPAYLRTRTPDRDVPRSTT
jgi:hypothetical protein